MALRKFKWFGNRYLEQFKEAYAKDLEKAAIYLTNQVKKTINQGKSPPSSAPGEPPHRWKGLLMRSITWQIDKENLKARVGTNLPYARHLELGTEDMAARPFLRVTFVTNYNKISDILGRKKKL